MSGHVHDYMPGLDPTTQLCRNARFGCDAPERKIPTRPAPAQEHSETSKAAARSVEKHRHRDRVLVFDAFQKAGTRGLTDEELIDATALSANTARPRRIDLWHEQLVTDSGIRRPTRSGRSAVVWVLSSELQTELPQDVVAGR